MKQNNTQITKPILHAGICLATHRKDLPKSAHSSILCGSIAVNGKNVLLLIHGRTVAKYIFNSEVSMWELNER